MPTVFYWLEVLIKSFEWWLWTRIVLLIGIVWIMQWWWDDVRSS